MMETVGSSGALPKCSFLLPKAGPLDRADVLRALGCSISLSDVKHIDFSRNRVAVVTVATWDGVRKLVSGAFSIMERR